MPRLIDYGYSASGASIDFEVMGPVDEVACRGKAILSYGENNKLSFEYSMLRDDVKAFVSVLTDQWDYLIQNSPFVSLEPAFSISIAEINSGLGREINSPLYRIFFWIDAGELTNYRATGTGIGICILQQREAINEFAKAVNKQFEEICKL